ncbi:hypothetical protein CN676_06245 [Bacillus wiedmannii]|uniref:hypothetical protein n=1 Tax=Bacillus wiedmannii TaxID=1890302 RepID=UPI000BEE62F7|nr:hypothetical protein [Bacillus wiedmannii]PEG10647.1 hypothetical protein CON96_08155 [Bacillus wiedmannii]PEJ55125.1 hypothetical protein CN676_06245 [Bacillus wiedmannii]PEL41816.1 hypothetical protein CN607_10150 [Bacillus wiedmannii]PEO92287.1 hypothetical protein CN554_27890 [Bacillus wiedmannii]PGA32908.1 hypothetical protein COL74_17770 [Bacillus wiedmannii]
MFAYTATTLTLCCISILITSYISKRNGTLMEYMVFIMSFSMSIGLSIGFYLGILFKGELLYSTLLAILISSCIGFLVGLRFHLFTALEGMFSGLMASMMGAMITEMLNAQQAHSILFISLLLSITITMSCMIQLLSDTFSTFIQRRFLLLLSISAAIIVAVFVTFPDHTPPPSPGHDQHIH